MGLQRAAQYFGFHVQNIECRSSLTPHLNEQRRRVAIKSLNAYTARRNIVA